MEMAAEELGMDSVELRCINAITEGDTSVIGHTIENTLPVKECLETMKNSDFWKRQAEEKDPCVGYGISMGFLSCGFGKRIPDNCTIKVSWNKGEKTRVYCGYTDLGQGNTTSIAAVAAEALQLEMEDIEMIMADSSLTADSASTAASRSTFTDHDPLAIS